MREQQRQLLGTKERQVPQRVRPVFEAIHQAVQVFPDIYDTLLHNYRGEKIPGVVPQNRIVANVIQFASEKLTTQISVTGIENAKQAEQLLDEDIAVLIAANHTFSHFSTVAIEQGLHRSGLDSFRDRIIWPLGISLQENKIAKHVLSMVPYIPVWPKEREAKNEEEQKRKDTMNIRGIATASRAIKSGRAIALYPEGTRGYDYPMGPAQEGTEQYFGLAWQKEMAILPVSLIGAGEVMPKNTWFPEDLPVTVVFGKVVLRSELLQKYQHEPRNKQLPVIRDAIMNSIALGLPEKYRGYYKDTAIIP